jgi:hypothetical protein
MNIFSYDDIFKGKKVQEIQIQGPRSPTLYNSFFEQLKTITVQKQNLGFSNLHFLTFCEKFQLEAKNSRVLA